MTFDEYLVSMLGKKGARELKKHKHSESNVIIIAGPQGPTGKSTLGIVLKKHGFNVIDGFRTYRVELDKPIENMVQNFADTVD